MSILIVDNYDSFTYNLYHLVRQCTSEQVIVKRNDEIELEDVACFDQVIISPGPGIPEEAGITVPLIQHYAPEKKIFGVCLGHQAIAVALGGKLINTAKVYHAVVSDAKLENNPGSIFNSLPLNFAIGRYHSWIVDETQLPAGLRVTARDEQGYIMAMEHTSYRVTGVQFHPESVLTAHGKIMMMNWLES